MRRLSAHVHRWTGITIGVACAYLALTGAWVLIKPQLNATVSPYIQTTSTCQRPASVDLIAASAQRIHSTSPIESVWVMGNPSSSVIVRFSDQMQGYFDPCTGQLIAMHSRWSSFFGAAEYIHRLRFMGERTGRLLGGAIALATCLLLVALGLFTWWPRRLAAWPASLKINSALSGRPRLRNRHSVTGVLVAPILLAITVAGSFMAFDPDRRALNAILGSASIEWPAARSIDPRAPPAIDSALANAAGILHSRPLLMTVQYPPKHGVVEITIIESETRNPRGVSFVFADARSGKILEYIPYARTPASERAYAWLLSLHLGLVGGLPGQVATLLALLGLLYLFYSGVRSFTIRKRAPAAPLSSREFVRMLVHDVSDVSQGVKRFTLVPADNAQLSESTPGAHVSVMMANGLVRQYSLCNGPEDIDRLVLAVKLDEGGKGGSRAMHDLEPGQCVFVDQPRNNFKLVHTRQKPLLLAAGIGITPIISMVRYLKAGSMPFELHYFGRSIDSLPFVDDLRQACGTREFSLHIGLSREEVGEKIQALMKSIGCGAHVYVCGPSGFIAKAEACAASAGLPKPHFHREFFSNDLLAIATPGSSFSVTLARSGGVLLVEPDETLLSALKRHGIKVDSSCEQGLCGSCAVGVLSGDIDHRDLVLSDAEKSRGNRIITCVSRCRGNLILDL